MSSQQLRQACTWQFLLCCQVNNGWHNWYAAAAAAVCVVPPRTLPHIHAGL